MSPVMLAMLFITEQRAAHREGLELLTPRDIVDMLKETLPRKPDGKDGLAERINTEEAPSNRAADPPSNQHPHSGSDSMKINSGNLTLSNDGR